MNTARHPHRSIFAVAATLALVLAGTQPTHAKPVPEDGPYADDAPAATVSPSLNDSHCKIERVGDRLVQCDHLAGAAPAPQTVPEQGASR